MRYKEGQILKSEWGYFVEVKKDQYGELYGELICSEKHSCRNIPYSLNGNFRIVSANEMVRELAYNNKQ